MTTDETSMFGDDTFDERKEAILNDLMQIRGVGKTQAEKFYNAQLYSVEQIASTPIMALMDKTGLSKSGAQKLIDNAKPLCNLGEIKLATEILEDEKVERYLSTGSEQFNELLGGGYPLKLITQLYAENGLGKTQCAFTASVMATRPEEEGGLDSHVIYIDTEGTFNAQRIAQIAETRGYDPADVLSKIHCARVLTSGQQVLIMDKVNELAVEFPIRLIVVDSITSRFRSDYAGGRQNLPERQGILGQHLSDLLSFADRNNAVVLVTNQVSAVPDANPMFGPTFQPVGGNILGHASSHIVMIRRGKQGSRIMKLTKSNHMPSGECVVQLSVKGICDKE